MRKAFFLVVALATLGFVGCKPKSAEGPKDGNSVATFDPPKDGTLTPKANGPGGVPGGATSMGGGNMPPQPGMSARSAMPNMPAANVTVSDSKYAVGNSSIEVDGVCKVTEDTVACWKADGSKNKDLEERIEKSVSDTTHGFGGRFTVAYKKKNRVIVFKNTSAYGGSGGASIYISSVGENPYGGGDFGGFNLQTDSAPGQPVNTRYECRSVAAEPGAKTTKARLQSTEIVVSGLLVQNKKGASVSHESAKVTVESTAKGNALRGPMPGPMSGGMGGPMGGQPQNVWTVTFKVSGASPELHFSCGAADSQGRPIQWVDKSGKPVSQEEFSKWSQENNRIQSEAARAGKRLPPPQQKYFMAQGGYSSSSGSQLTMITQIDPKYISKFIVGATKTKTIDLTKIPLDPR